MLRVYTPDDLLGQIKARMDAYHGKMRIPRDVVCGMKRGTIFKVGGFGLIIASPFLGGDMADFANGATGQTWPVLLVSKSSGPHILYATPLHWFFWAFALAGGIALVFLGNGIPRRLDDMIARRFRNETPD